MFLGCFNGCFEGVSGEKFIACFKGDTRLFRVASMLHGCVKGV